MLAQERTPTTDRLPEGAERRREPRVDASLAVVCRTSGAIVRGRTGNVSYRGMFVVSEKLPPIGSEAVFALQAAEGTICGRGLVRWVRPRASAADAAASVGFGVQFTELDTSSRDHLWKLVDRLLAANESDFGVTSSGSPSTPVPWRPESVENPSAPARSRTRLAIAGSAIFALGLAGGWLLRLLAVG